MGDRVDRWLENTLPPTEEDSGRQDVQLAILKERMRTRQRARRNRRLRGGAVVVSLAVLGVFFGGVVDLGGDSFDLVETGSTTYQGNRNKIMKNEFRGVGIGVTPDMSEEDIAELNQQYAAGEGTVVSVAGFSIKGVTHWSIEVHRNINGRITIGGDQPIDPPSRGSHEILRFMQGEWLQIEPEIESGVRKPTGTQVMVFDGLSYMVDYWVLDSEEFGEVTRYKGVPIR